MVGDPNGPRTNPHSSQDKKDRQGHEFVGVKKPVLAEFQDGREEVKYPRPTQEAGDHRPDVYDRQRVQLAAATTVLRFVLYVRVFVARIQRLVPGDPVRPVPLSPGLQPPKPGISRVLVFPSPIVIFNVRIKHLRGRHPVLLPQSILYTRLLSFELEVGP
jgi:hypothetical protein